MWYTYDTCIIYYNMKLYYMIYSLIYSSTIKLNIYKSTYGRDEWYFIKQISSRIIT